jgi:hypothetical protein
MLYMKQVMRLLSCSIFLHKNNNHNGLRIELDKYSVTRKSRERTCPASGLGLQ